MPDKLSDTDEVRSIDAILEQAFTDGASDTMWQNDRHVEIFATAKKDIEAILTSEKRKLLIRELKQLIADTLEPEQVGGKFIHPEVAEFAKQQKEFINKRINELEKL